MKMLISAWAGEGGVASGNGCALALGTRLWDWNKVSKLQVHYYEDTKLVFLLLKWLVKSLATSSNHKQK